MMILDLPKKSRLGQTPAVMSQGGDPALFRSIMNGPVPFPLPPALPETASPITTNLVNAILKDLRSYSTNEGAKDRYGKLLTISDAELSAIASGQTLATAISSVTDPGYNELYGSQLAAWLYGNFRYIMKRYWKVPSSGSGAVTAATVMSTYTQTKDLYPTPESILAVLDQPFAGLSPVASPTDRLAVGSAAEGAIILKIITLTLRLWELRIRAATNRLRAMPVADLTAADAKSRFRLVDQSAYDQMSAGRTAAEAQLAIVSQRFDEIEARIRSGELIDKQTLDAVRLQLTAAVSQLQATQDDIAKNYVAVGQYDQAAQALATASADLSMLKNRIAAGEYVPQAQLAQLESQVADFTAQIGKFQDRLQLIADGKDDIYVAVSECSKRGFAPHVEVMQARQEAADAAIALQNFKNSIGTVYIEAAQCVSPAALSVANQKLASAERERDMAVSNYSELQQRLASEYVKTADLAAKGYLPTAEAESRLQDVVNQLASIESRLNVTVQDRDQNYIKVADLNARGYVPHAQLVQAQAERDQAVTKMNELQNTVAQMRQEAQVCFTASERNQLTARAESAEADYKRQLEAINSEYIRLTDLAAKGYVTVQSRDAVAAQLASLEQQYATLAQQMATDYMKKSECTTCIPPPSNTQVAAPAMNVSPGGPVVPVIDAGAAQIPSYVAAANPGAQFDPALAVQPVPAADAQPTAAKPQIAPAVAAAGVGIPALLIFGGPVGAIAAAGAYLFANRKKK
jgi:hypothetical protein